ncbi:hypothetical protein GCM10027271_42300 [Saccharopolyspora gloriosae]
MCDNNKFRRPPPRDADFPHNAPNHRRKSASTSTTTRDSNPKPPQ